MRSAAVIVTVTLSVWITACGSAPDPLSFEHRRPYHNSEELIFATEEEIAAGTVVEHEYLVGFKKYPESHEITDDFLDTFWQKSADYYHDFVDTGLLTDIHFLSSIDPSDRRPSPVSHYHHNLAFPQFGPENFSPIHHDPMIDINLVRFSSSSHAKRVLKDLLAAKKIWFAEPNRISQISNTPQEEQACNHKSTGDPQQDRNKKIACLVEQTKDYQQTTQYHITQTKVHEALDVISRMSAAKTHKILNRPPIIAILDSGVDIAHPALNKRAVDLTGAYGNKHCGNYSKGCRVELDVNRSQFPKGVLGDGKAFPIGSEDHGQRCNANNCVHGTQAAGLAVGYQKGTYYGTCPFCEFLAVKITLGKQLGKSHVSSIRDDSVIRALQFISQFRNKDGQYIIRVVNNSYGTSHYNRAVAMLVRTLSSNRHGGMVIVGAAGNEDSSYRTYPSGYGSVISVGNIDENNAKHKTSNYGKWVDISAPGTKIQAPSPGEGTGFFTGTSASAPIVSGIAGLLIASNPTADAKHIVHTLLDTANNRALYEKNKDYYSQTVDKETYFFLGRGVVDAHKAIRHIHNKTPNLEFKHRVKGCASVGTNVSSSLPIHHPFQILIWLLIALMPVLITFYHRVYT